MYICSESNIVISNMDHSEQLKWEKLDLIILKRWYIVWASTGLAILNNIFSNGANSNGQTINISANSVKYQSVIQPTMYYYIIQHN